MAGAKATPAGNYVPSLIRTFVPIAVGAVLAYLAVHFGLHPSQAQAAAITAPLTAVISAVYYALVRYLETKYPIFGILLGKKAQPVYAGASTPQAGVSPRAPAPRGPWIPPTE